MRASLLLLVPLLLAGCLAGDPGAQPTPTPTGPGGGDMTSALPAPINDTRTVTGSADPLGNPLPAGGGAPCASPSSQCFRSAFQMNVTGNVTATLSWTQPASDFDLHVFKDGKSMGTEGVTNPPGTSEKVTYALQPGKYEVVVVAWAVAQDTYKLSATFAP